MPSATPTPVDRLAVVVAPAPAPLDPGNKTSEFSLTRLFALVGGAVALSLPILAGLSTSLDGLGAAFPGAKWIGVALGVVGTLVTVATTINRYIGGRTDVKVAHVAAATAQAQRAAVAVSSEAQAADVLRGG